MSTIVCQNLVSCFESQLSETTTTLKLRVAAAPPPAALEVASGDHLELGNWGFLQTNTNNINDCSSYTNPSSSKMNSSYSKLSHQSLQLCTENLGSETGSDTVSDCSSIFSASPPLSPTSNSNSNDRATFALDDYAQKRTSRRDCRKIKNFPPPLTTMSGSSSLQVRRHIDGGRLIIEAVEGPFRNSYLHAERSDGRLKLSFTTATATCSGAEQEEEEEDEENLDECGSGDAAVEEIEELKTEKESEKEEFDEEKNLREKFQRFSRCKESGHGIGNKGLCSNWKPALWVATS